MFYVTDGYQWVAIDILRSEEYDPEGQSIEMWENLQDDELCAAGLKLFDSKIPVLCKRENVYAVDDVWNAVDAAEAWVDEQNSLTADRPNERIACFADEWGDMPFSPTR